MPYLEDGEEHIWQENDSPDEIIKTKSLENLIQGCVSKVSHYVVN